MKKILVLVFAFLFILFVGNAFAVEMITNGGFEDGLTGWSATNVAALGTYVYPYTSISFGEISPTEGNYQAVMSYDKVHDSDLSQGFSIDPTLYTGATISFDYNLWAWDRIVGDPLGTDYLAVTYNTTELLTVPFRDPTETYGASTSSVLGWHTFSTTLPASVLSGGPLTLKFHVQNYYPPGDPQQMVAFIDNVSIDATPIPEPATMFLLGSGLLGVGVFGLRKKRSL